VVLCLKHKYILPNHPDKFSGLLSVAGDNSRQHVTCDNIKCDKIAATLSLKATPSHEGISNEFSNHFLLALLHYLVLLWDYTSTSTCDADAVPFCTKTRGLTAEGQNLLNKLHNRVQPVYNDIGL
jgi:hypothetical protein